MSVPARVFLALTSPLHIVILVIGSWRGVVSFQRRDAVSPEAISDGSPFVQSRGSRRSAHGRAVSIDRREVDALGLVGSAIGALAGGLMVTFAFAVVDEPAWQWTLFAVLVAIATVTVTASVLTLLRRRIVIRRG
ncbi:MAG: hypothetical protein JWM86_963 [Thermoleophilia bacterium]|nr:hypothetical protein [Thermoleophilia bacterium]